MSATINRAEIDRKMTDHLARWFGVLSSTRNNPEMAVDAINDLYHRLKKVAPAAILWCESPFQMAVIPALVTNIVQHKDWLKTVEEMRQCDKSDKKAWEHEFERQWLKLKSNHVDRLATKTTYHEIYNRVSDATKEAAIERLRVHLRTLLWEGKLKPGSMFSAKKAATADIPAAPDLEFLKHIMATVQAKLAAATKLKLEGLEVFSSLAAALSSGVWNPRLVSSLIPAAESVLGVPDLNDPQIKICGELKGRCSAFERAATDRLIWHFSMFPQPAPPQEALQRLTQARRTQFQWESIVETFQSMQEISQATYQHAKANPNLTNQLAFYFPSAAAWLPFGLALRFIAPDFLDAELQNDLDTLAFLSHAAAGYYFCSKVCFVCTKPLVMQTTEEGRFHNPDGPAVLWSDGLKTYAWKGTIVTADIIEEKESITYRKITEETNAELRRVLMEIYGESRYLMDCNAKVISEDSCGTLYRLEFSNDEALVMVRVRNSTPEPDGTYKSYFLRVPPAIKTAREAVAWTFEMESTDYRPSSQT